MRPGGLAEALRGARPSHNLMRLPATVPYELAACLPVAYGTALRMMVTNGQVRAGEKVLILGASGVGTCCVQLAKLAGAEVYRLRVERRQARAAKGPRRRSRDRLLERGFCEMDLFQVRQAA